MREVKILMELMNCDGYLNVDYFANVLNVSTRTILNDIKSLNIDSEHFGYKILNLRGKGYYLEIKNEQKFQNYMNRLNNQEINYKSDRIPNIIAILLLHNDYISQEFIANFLNVSKSIIKNDMDKVNELLSEHDIKLQKKAHYGVKLDIDNFKRKLCILYLYEEGNDLIIKEINGVIHSNFQEVERLLISLLETNKLNTNYVEMKKIDTFIKICIYSNLFQLNCGHDTADQETLYENIAIQLKEKIEENYNTSLLQNELNDLALYITQKTSKKIEKIKYAEGLEEKLDNFFKECDRKYDTNFNDDDEFKLSLLSHVSLLLDRLHQSISFSNPLVDEISVKYPLTFNIAIQFVQELEKTYDVVIEQDEIGFIATHLAVHMERQARQVLESFNRIAIVCSSGGGSAFLIKLKLETLFNGKDIRTFSLLQEDELMKYHPDIIFTITDLYYKYNVPVIKINELLDDNDILKIKNMFNLGRQNVIENKSKLVSLMRKDCFFIIEDDLEYEEILKMMSKNVEKLGLADDEYEKNVLLRESYVSTIYENGLAIPHPLNNCAKENVISVGIVKPKNKMQKKVKLVFLVNLVANNMKLFQEVTRVLYEIMENEESVHFLRESSSFEDFTMRLYTLNK